MRIVLAVLSILAAISAAHAFGLGKEGYLFGRLGAGSKHSTIAPQPTGKILLADGVSFILQTDGTSLICRAGGC